MKKVALYCFLCLGFASSCHIYSLASYSAHYNNNRDVFEEAKNYFKSEYDELRASRCVNPKKSYPLYISWSRVVEENCYPSQQDFLQNLLSLRVFKSAILPAKNQFEFILDYMPSKHLFSDRITIYLIYMEEEKLSFRYQHMQGRKKKLDEYWWLVEDKVAD